MFTVTPAALLSDCVPEQATPAAAESRYELVDGQLGDEPLPAAATLSQLLTVRAQRLGDGAQPPYVALTVRHKTGQGARRSRYSVSLTCMAPGELTILHVL